MIDLDTGDWREVVVAPDELILTPLFMGLPLAFVAEDNQLISHGIGLSTADWKRDGIRCEDTPGRTSAHAAGRGAVVAAARPRSLSPEAACRGRATVLVT